jgi:glyoxylase-like metal-dependent hydrolase (beta-lactamase superfamily II)
MRVTGELQREAWLEHRLPPVEQVRPGLWSIPVPIPRSPLRYTLTYILEAPDGLLVLDPGWDVDDAWNALVDGLGVIGAGVTDVHGVVVTHVHPDHHGLSARLGEASGAWVAMHPDEAASLPARVWAAGDRGDEDEQWLRRCGLPAEVVAELVLPPEAMKPFLAMAEPDRLFQDGDLVPEAGRRLRAVWTPGHTPGHLCFHDETDDLLLSGDHVLPRISPNIGLQPHTAAPPLAAYLASLQRVAARYDSAEVLPAHEYRFIGLAHRVRVLLDHHARRADEIVAVLEQRPQSTVWQIAGELTWSRGWSQVTGFMRRAAVAETAAHLQWLRDSHRVAVLVDPRGGRPDRYSSAQTSASRVGP